MQFISHTHFRVTCVCSKKCFGEWPISGLIKYVYYLNMYEHKDI